MKKKDDAGLALFSAEELCVRRIACPDGGYPPSEARHDNLREYVLALEAPAKNMAELSPPAPTVSIELVREARDAINAVPDFACGCIRAYEPEVLAKLDAALKDFPQF